MENINFIAEMKINEFKMMKEEKEKLINTCVDMINYYTDKLNSYKNDISESEEKLKQELICMIPESDYKQTKTQSSYKTPSAKIIKKMETKQIKLSDDYKESEIAEEYIKVKRSVDWINFKKILDIAGDNVINKETGEIIESCRIEIKPAETSIKII
jgi:hypothetical protein